MDFVSLHNHTHYSILDSLIDPEDLLLKVKELGQTAVAITDHGTLASAWKAYKASQKIGVKLIIGCEMYFLDDVKNTEQRFRHVILLAKNAVGYRNLLTLNKEGFDNNVVFAKKVYPIIDWTLLEKYSEGLICLTSCSNGIIAQLLMKKKTEEAESQLQRLMKIFGDNLGLEVQANTLRRGSNLHNDVIEQVFVNAQIIKLSKKFNVKCVATTNSHYLNKEDAATHDVLLAIGSHQPVSSNFRLKYPCPEFYMKTGDEVKSFFERNYGAEYAEELCKNTVYFADLCEDPKWIDPKFSNPSGKELPEFPVANQEDYQEFLQWKSSQQDNFQKLEEDKLYLRYKCFTAFDKFKTTIPQEKHSTYIDRINSELETLEYQGFSSYMLIVADYVEWCNKCNIQVGPGRGSVAGCFIAFLLNIHKADSIKYNLIFERFQNKLRMEAPDIDQDVSTIHRERVLGYLRDKYGDDHMCCISNFNTITPKVYVRDVARAYEFNGSREEAVKIGNDLAGMISADAAKYSDFAKVVEKTPLLGEYSKKYPELTNCGAIVGQPRSQSQHAAGIVIAKRPLVGLVPIRKDKDKVSIIEYDKIDAEQNGMVKMDILGLSTLDLINSAIELIKIKYPEFNNEHLNYDDNDEKTYELISKGDTYGVFQFGTSGGTIDLCKKIKPRSIEDLAIITTLARPAAANIRSSFIAAREGKKEVVLLHPTLETAFKKTYGFGLFDESILQIGRDVAGWSYNDADRIRKMIKDKGKNPAKDKALREEFIADAIKNGVNIMLAPRIWDEEVSKFASYTFNKSHAVAYSMISYQTAYLKAHFPIEFLLANLMAEINSNAPDSEGNIAKIKKEIRKHRVKILAPDLNKSQLTYTRSQDNELLTGLDALKFVGDDAIKDIIEKRPFSSFFDFMHRVDSRKVRANTIQALASSGCFDNFEISRKSIFLYCSDYRKKLQVWLKRHDPKVDKFQYPWPNEPEWPLPELYALEKYYLGESFICGKKQAYGNFFNKADAASLAKLKKAPDKTQIKSVCGEVKDFFEFKVKKETSKYYGMPMIKATIEDIEGEQCSCTIFPDRWSKVIENIKERNGRFVFEAGAAIHFSGITNVYEDDLGIILNDLYDFHPPPPKPKDLKPKKVNLKMAKKEKVGELQISLIEELEDDLITEGLIDLGESDEAF